MPSEVWDHELALHLPDAQRLDLVLVSDGPDRLLLGFGPRARRLRWRGEQVDQLAAVQLHHRCLELVLPVLGVRRHLAEQLVDRPRDDAFQVRGARHADHGVRLAPAGLAVREHGHVVAVQHRLHQLLAVGEDVLLRPRHEHGVVGVRGHVWGLLAVQPPVPADHLDGDEVHLPYTALAALRLLLLAHGPDAAVHADGALEILDQVVDPLPHLVVLHEVDDGPAELLDVGHGLRQPLLDGDRDVQVQ
mmetsp:Transcript_72255/g.201675  ORF Transcript_72255/g.201675 Transcript_72255/m.201675 type:complete len:247 (-) Transcript_72255:1611-2351(-)